MNVYEAIMWAVVAVFSALLMVAGAMNIREAKRLARKRKPEGDDHE